MTTNFSLAQSQHLITLMHLKISLWPQQKKKTFKDVVYFFFDPASQPCSSTKLQRTRVLVTEKWDDTLTHIFLSHPTKLVLRPLHETTNVQGSPSIGA